MEAPCTRPESYHPVERTALGSWRRFSFPFAVPQPSSTATTPARFNRTPGLLAAHAADKSPDRGMNLAAVKTRLPDPSLLARDTVTTAKRGDNPSGARTDPSRFRVARLTARYLPTAGHRAPTRCPPSRAAPQLPRRSRRRHHQSEVLTSPVLSVHLIIPHLGLLPWTKQPRPRAHNGAGTTSAGRSETGTSVWRSHRMSDGYPAHYSTG